mmetsp:Transcript_7997/g.24957  ORF Transcript_7997/g.24957 Transcript_7997/m.24957 type:complete len:212 (-) Transcript_7997:572-1207(-)
MEPSIAYRSSEGFSSSAATSSVSFASSSSSSMAAVYSLTSSSTRPASGAMSTDWRSRRPTRLPKASESSTSKLFCSDATSNSTSASSSAVLSLSSTCTRLKISSTSGWRWLISSTRFAAPPSSDFSWSVWPFWMRAMFADTPCSGDDTTSGSFVRRDVSDTLVTFSPSTSLNHFVSGSYFSARFFWTALSFFDSSSNLTPDLARFTSFLPA